MANILTTLEAANVLRTTETDETMLDLLPMVDKFIEMATGRDWTADTNIRPEAKAAARMLLVRWHEDPGGMGAGETLGHGLRACLTQLEALAQMAEISGVPDEALALVSTNISGEMAITASFILIFNHEMASGATSCVTLEDASLATVTTVNSLDVSGKILTINPSASLTAASAYTIVIEDAPDVYGQTIKKEIAFWTA
jgi:hypothetical protein